MSAPLLVLKTTRTVWGREPGPLVRGALFVWQMNRPYRHQRRLLLMIALAVGWKAPPVAEGRHPPDEHREFRCQRAPDI